MERECQRNNRLAAGYRPRCVRSRRSCWTACWMAARRAGRPGLPPSLSSTPQARHRLLLSFHCPFHPSTALPPPPPLPPTVRFHCRASRSGCPQPTRSAAGRRRVGRRRPRRSAGSVRSWSRRPRCSSTAPTRRRSCWPRADRPANPYESCRSAPRRFSSIGSSSNIAGVFFRSVARGVLRIRLGVRSARQVKVGGAAAVLLAPPPLSVP